MKIAVVAACPFPLARGTPVRILRMAEALAARGHEIHVATYHLGEGSVAAGVHIHRIDDIPSYRRLNPGPTYRKVLVVDRSLRRLLRKLLRDIRFDLIHAHHYEGLLVGATARVDRSVPLIYDAHTLLMSELPYYPLGLPAPVKRVMGRWMDNWLPTLADHTVTVTDTIRNKLINDAGINPDRVSVIANGVEVDHFDPTELPPRASRNGRTLIFTGNLAEYQGIDLLLRAFALVAPKIADVRLRIATNSRFDPYEPLARELGIRDRIDILASPPFRDLPRVIVDADIAVNPRVDCDGVPVKLLNYMAAARPVVSFDSSAPGVVHGSTGWLAAGGDVPAFADGIVALLKDPELAGRIGRAARVHVVQHCSWALAAERCEELYGRLGSARK
jgi:glycosyltransferase involved in cell wall biosynthesis